MQPRWRGYDKYTERMMKFSKTYPKALKHGIPVTLRYFIDGIQCSCIGNDYSHLLNILTEFWPDLIAILEVREFS